MAEQPELLRFLADLNQEVRTLADTESDEAGASLEEKATEYLTGLLADANETENARVCTSIKHNKARQVQHKINGYALSEDLEELALFITFFQENNELRSFPKDEVTKAANQSERFLKNIFNGYREEIDESESIFELAQILFDHAKELVRVKIFILTNARLTSDAAIPNRTLKNAVVQFHLWDLDRFHRLWTSHNRREPIEIDFVQTHGQPLACLPMPVNNDDYQTCLAIVPGTLLAALYAEHGARLLEQNVRSFLDFTGKVNQGIRDTIRNVPHRFLAYNNGIAATAEVADIRQAPGGGWGIYHLRDLQIVNGGQTTAAIFRTQRQVKDANIDAVFVQMKLTVLRRPEEMEEIIPLISQFANSQNGIQAADLSANNNFNRQLEKISRSCWAPAAEGSPAQTRWFFERARGQYKVALNREASPSRQTAFKYQNPREQLFTKEVVAKMEHIWGGLPWMVARGAQKNYAEFLKKKLEKKKETDKDVLPNTVFFEDLVAKLILFQAADKEYGRGATKIGDYKFLTVPYALAWLNHVTDGRIDLFKIWKQQAISDALRDAIRRALPTIDKFLLKNAGNKLVSERAKQEDCWRELLAIPFPDDKYQTLMGRLKDDLADPKQQKKRLSQSEDELAAEERRQEEESLRGLGSEAWEAIEQWGRQTEELTPHKRDRCNTIARSIVRNRALTDSEVEIGSSIVDLILEKAPQLLEDLYNRSAAAEATSPKSATAVTVAKEATLADVNALLEWDRKQKVKRIWPKAIEQLRAFKKGEQVFNQYWQKRVGLWLDRFREYGFDPEDYRD
ncbi:MAG TPA: AIPR family protein [Hymenobacter sp.]|jgi:hypothetical protein|uniref:AIPR family protein n=1 Tax=Hymenobacter sp. TaxID=1898978 RepID=UPI002EDAF5E5